MLTNNGLVVPMVTTNLFFHKIFRDGAFTSNDAKVRRFALQKAMRAMDLGRMLGAKIFVCWGGREGSEVDAARKVGDALRALAKPLITCVSTRSSRVTTTPSPSSRNRTSRGGISTCRPSGHVLHFITTLDHPEMCGVNPENARTSPWSQFHARRCTSCRGRQVGSHRPEQSAKTVVSIKYLRLAHSEHQAKLHLVQLSTTSATAGGFISTRNRSHRRARGSRRFCARLCQELDDLVRKGAAIQGRPSDSRSCSPTGGRRLGGERRFSPPPMLPSGWTRNSISKQSAPASCTATGWICSSTKCSCACRTTSTCTHEAST